MNHGRQDCAGQLSQDVLSKIVTRHPTGDASQGGVRNCASLVRFAQSGQVGSFVQSTSS